MTANPDTVQSDAIKRLEECKVTDADIEVIKKCEKLQALCHEYFCTHASPYVVRDLYQTCENYYVIPSITVKGKAIYTPTFEQMIAIIEGSDYGFDGLIPLGKGRYYIRMNRGRFSNADSARQALSMACEFVLGGKDLRGGK